MLAPVLKRGISIRRHYMKAPGQWASCPIDGRGRPVQTVVSKENDDDDFDRARAPALTKRTKKACDRNSEQTSKKQLDPPTTVHT